MVPTTDAKVKGLSTFGLATCLGLILQSSEGKTSLAHVVYKRSDVATFIKNELHWIGGPEGGVKATIIRNASLLSQPEYTKHIINVSVVLYEIVQLLTECKVSSSVVDTDNGAIAIKREDSSIFVPAYDSPNPSNPILVIGTLCPYGLMRTLIHQMPFTGPCSMDIQYDGTEWTIAKNIEHYGGIMFTTEQLRPYQNLEVSAVVKQLYKEKAMQRSRLVPGNFLNDSEYDAYLTSCGRTIQQYLIVKKQYNEGTTYKMFTMTGAQRDLITSINGEVKPGMDRGMYIFCAPTLYLTPNVRKLLLIDRIGFRYHKDPSNLFAHCEMSRIKGWRSEADMNKKDFYLVTFPYNDESERLRMREVLKVVIEKA
jgi:hypothetical protein